MPNDRSVGVMLIAVRLMAVKIQEELTWDGLPSFFTAAVVAAAAIIKPVRIVKFVVFVVVITITIVIIIIVIIVVITVIVTTSRQRRLHLAVNAAIEG